MSGAMEAIKDFALDLASDWQGLAIKALVIGVSTVLLTKLAERNAFASAVIIAFPLMTAITMALLYIDTGDAARAVKFGYTAFWMILASMSFFFFLFISQKLGLGFWLGFIASIGVTALSIVGLTLLLRRFGIDLLSNV
jgi:hypothetical protein